MPILLRHRTQRGQLEARAVVPVHGCRLARSQLQQAYRHAMVAQNFFALRHFSIRNRRRHLTCAGDAKQKESGGGSSHTRQF